MREGFAAQPLLDIVEASLSERLTVDSYSTRRRNT
jgi:hypothetical protein